MMDIFQKLLAGGIIGSDEMGEAWDVVFRAQRLSPALNASATIHEMRERLSEIIDKPIDNSTTIFIPFHTNFGKHITTIGKNVFINHACSFLDLGGITIEDDVLIGPRVNLITENHPIDPSQRKHLDLKSIVIKKGAWIGNSRPESGKKIDLTDRLLKLLKELYAVSSKYNFKLPLNWIRSRTR
jgi:hypothetical protein